MVPAMRRTKKQIICGRKKRTVCGTASEKRQRRYEPLVSKPWWIQALRGYRFRDAANQLIGSTYRNRPKALQRVHKQWSIRKKIRVKIR